MPKGPPLTLLILAVPDLEQATRFYEAALGWERTVRAPSYAEYALPNGLRFGLYQREGFGLNTGQTPVQTPQGALAPVELYLQVESLDDAVALAVRAGARVLSAAALRDWGDEVAYLSDPCGNVLALARPA